MEIYFKTYKNKFKLALAAIISLVYISSPAFAFAAEFSLSPRGGEYSVEDSISISFFVKTPSNAINAVSGDINYTSSTLQVVSVSTSNSLVDFWAQQPSYSNSTGVINFAGVAFTPGYTGSNGNVITATFKAIKEGEASIYFTNGSVLANDGLGTELLTRSDSATYTITPKAIVELEPEEIIEEPEIPEPIIEEEPPIDIEPEEPIILQPASTDKVEPILVPEKTYNKYLSLYKDPFNVLLVHIFVLLLLILLLVTLHRNQMLSARVDRINKKEEKPDQPTRNIPQAPYMDIPKKPRD